LTRFWLISRRFISGHLISAHSAFIARTAMPRQGSTRTPFRAHFSTPRRNFAPTEWTAFPLLCISRSTPSGRQEQCCQVAQAMCLDVNDELISSKTPFNSANAREALSAGHAAKHNPNQIWGNYSQYYLPTIIEANQTVRRIYSLERNMAAK